MALCRKTLKLPFKTWQGFYSPSRNKLVSFFLLFLSTKSSSVQSAILIFHTGHQVERLTKVGQRFKEEISTMANKVFPFFLFLFLFFSSTSNANSFLPIGQEENDIELSKSIKVIGTTMVGIREQAEVTEEKIHSTFEPLIASVITWLRDREAALISEVETTRHQKEKELQLQKDEVEFLLSGVRHAVLFSEALIKEGSETEVVSGHHQVVTRMATLSKE